MMQDTPMFHQVEGIYVDKGVNFAKLKDLIYKIIFDLFGEETKIRFRPSYFPFTEPSAEVDILSNNNKWLEILGCGIVNPVVLKIVILILQNIVDLLLGWVLKELQCSNIR